MIQIVYWVISSIIVSILSIYIMNKEDDFNAYQAGIFVLGSILLGQVVLPIIIVCFICYYIGKFILNTINKITIN